jgi:flagellar hook assembly protein FlgD
VRLHFDLPTGASVSLAIYDVRGRKVRQVIDKSLPPGAHAYAWDGRDDAGSQRATGVYYARLSISSGQSAEKMVRKLVLLR